MGCGEDTTTYCQLQPQHSPLLASGIRCVADSSRFDSLAGFAARSSGGGKSCSGRVFTMSLHMQYIDAYIYICLYINICVHYIMFFKKERDEERKREDK